MHRWIQNRSGQHRGIAGLCPEGFDSEETTTSALEAKAAARGGLKESQRCVAPANRTYSSVRIEIDAVPYSVWLMLFRLLFVRNGLWRRCRIIWPCRECANRCSPGRYLETTRFLAAPEAAKQCFEHSWHVGLRRGVLVGNEHFLISTSVMRAGSHLPVWDASNEQHSTFSYLWSDV